MAGPLERENGPLRDGGRPSSRGKERLESILARYNPVVDAEMREAIGPSPLPLYGMMRYHLGWLDAHFAPVPASGGKKLRPALCLLTCQAVGGDWTRAVPAAAGIELLHNFSLIHDDIEDESVERRHRATVWSLWGEAQAINVGDALHIIADQALARLIDHGHRPELVLQAMQEFQHASLALTEGQYLDMSFENRMDVDVRVYLEMIGQKTAALIACATGLGALLGRAKADLVARYRSFGEKLGLAFQIRDDYLGIWGDQRETGKSTASDIASRKKSLPVIYALQRATGEERRQLLEYYESREVLPDAVPKVVALLDSLGAASYAETTADHYGREALREIADADGDPSALGDLRFLSEHLVRRTS